MTLAIISPVTFSDTTLPRFPYESVPGTILHVEPARSAFIGVPADGATIPDLAGNLVGAGAVVSSVNMVSSTGLVERSAKGGLHVAIKSPAATFGYFEINPSVEVHQYILSNITHEFFFSVWGYLTQAGTVGNEALFAYTFTSSPGTDQCLSLSLMDGSAYPPPPKLKGSRRAPLGSLIGKPEQSYYANASVQGYTGTITMTAAQAAADRACTIFGCGAHGPFSGSTGGTATGGASKIFYRAFIEDTTVSGRTFAELSVIDYGHYVQQVLTPGGRYHGDTYTDPATLS